MIVEQVVFIIVKWFSKRLEKLKFLKRKKLELDYSCFVGWRKKLLEKVNRNELKEILLKDYTEKLASEYYCLNNIIIGIVFLGVILGNINWLFYIYLAISLIFIVYCMYLWLTEYEVLYDLKDNSKNNPKPS
jgi:hypothetical protein